MTSKFENFIDYISYKIVPALTGDNSAPEVAFWNANFLNWFYLKKIMQELSGTVIKGVCLDIGSGSSPYEKFLNVEQYISLDQYKSRAAIYKNNSHALAADAKFLPIESSTIDTVLLNQVMEHVDDHHALLEEIHRVLRKNGVLILSVPLIYHVHGEPYDYFRFTEYGLHHILAKNRFKISRFDYLGFGGTAIFSIVNAFIWQSLSVNLFVKSLRNTLLLPFILVVFAVNNGLGFMLDKIKLKKFSPNYIMVCINE